jgi:hypothetical protein
MNILNVIVLIISYIILKYCLIIEINSNWYISFRLDFEIVLMGVVSLSFYVIIVCFAGGGGCFCCLFVRFALVLVILINIARYSCSCLYFFITSDYTI